MKIKFWRQMQAAEKKLTEHQRYLWDLAKGQDAAANYHDEVQSHWFIFREGGVYDYATLTTHPSNGKPVGSLTAYFKHRQPYEGLVEIQDSGNRPWGLYAFGNSVRSNQRAKPVWALGMWVPQPRSLWPEYEGYVRHIRMWK